MFKLSILKAKNAAIAIWIVNLVLIGLVSSVSVLSANKAEGIRKAKIGETVENKNGADAYLSEIEPREAEGIFSSLASSDNQADIIELLEKLAKEEGVNFELKNANESDLLRFQIVTKGSYRSQISYFQRLESLPYVLRLENLDLKTGITDKKFNQPVWEATAVVSFILLP